MGTRKEKGIQDHTHNYGVRDNNHNYSNERILHFRGKSRLFLIITLSVFALVTVPVILPHITNTHMIYHILLHLFSLIIAIFLATVSLLSFNKGRSRRVLFMSLGFSALAVVELLYFIVAAHGISDVILPIVDIELQHVILFAMLCLFAVGILNFNNSGKRIK